MTWVVASSTIFGYAVGISDIRVSYGNNQTKDCLQKIYKITPDIAAAFSGSVKIGFEMIDHLREFLTDIPDEHAWKPDWVVKNWAVYAKKIFNEQDEGQKKRGCSLVILGAVPNETLGNSPFAKTVVYILSNENGFEPQEVPFGKWDGVGIGMDVSSYKTLINELNDADYPPLMQMEVGNPGRYGFAMQTLISMTISNNPSLKVSRYVHFCRVSHGQVEITALDTTEYIRQGRIEYKMPNVATSWEELENLLRQEGADALTATAR